MLSLLNTADAFLTVAPVLAAAAFVTFLGYRLHVTH